MVIPLKKNSILVARAVVDPHSDYFPVRLLHFGDEAVITLHKKKIGEPPNSRYSCVHIVIKTGREIDLLPKAQ